LACFEHSVLLKVNGLELCKKREVGIEKKKQNMFAFFFFPTDPPLQTLGFQFCCFQQDWPVKRTLSEERARASSRFHSGSCV